MFYKRSLDSQEVEVESTEVSKFIIVVNMTLCLIRVL